MSTIKVLDKEFEPYLSEQLIQEKITELAQQLNKEYAGKKPIFLSILNAIVYRIIIKIFKIISSDQSMRSFVTVFPI